MQRPPAKLVAIKPRIPIIFPGFGESGSDQRQVIVRPRITESGDSHHCVGVPIAAIKMLVGAAFRQRGTELLTQSERRGEGALVR